MTWFSWRASRLGAQSFFQSVDNSSNPVPDQSHIEIDQQTQPFVRKPQVGQELFLVNWSNFSERLDLHDNLVLDYQVRAKPHLKKSPFVDKRYWLLSGKAEASLLQLARKNFYINGFEQAWPQPHVDPIGGVHDLLGENIFRHFPDGARQDAKIAKKE
jgi:hypothetical protein